MKEIPKWVLEQLCAYDKRNPDSSIYDQDVLVTSGDKDCFCDNCFYGRTKLAEEIIKLYESK